MIAFVTVETSQTETGSYYCVRLGWAFHPKVVSVIQSLIRWF